MGRLTNGRAELPFYREAAIVIIQNKCRNINILYEF